MELKESTIADNLARVRERIADAATRSGRVASEITLVAVSKGQTVEKILQAVAAGQSVFGENYLQEAKMKVPLVRQSAVVELHFVGQLQSNKVREAVSLFDVIQTVDRLSLVKELKKRLTKEIQVLLQVNTSGEPQKGGCAPAEVPEIIGEILTIPFLQLKGLMTIGANQASVQEREEEFRMLRNLRDRCQNEFKMVLPQLSMGMSEDFELAIEEGATIVRVGTAIFGERQ